MTPGSFSLLSIIVIDSLFGLAFGVLYGIVWITNVTPGRYILSQRLRALGVLLPAILIMYPTQIFVDFTVLGDAEYDFGEGTIMFAIFGPLIALSLLGSWCVFLARDSNRPPAKTGNAE